MNCDESKALMHDYFDNILSDRQRADFDNHRRTCNACQYEFTRMKAYFDKLENISVIIPSPKSLFDEIVKDVQAMDEGKTTNSKEPAKVESSKKIDLSEASKVETVFRKQQPKVKIKSATKAPPLNSTTLLIYVLLGVIALFSLVLVYLRFVKK
ncbi:MAG: zf-HC2 domain-containing protein [Ignavibacteria bacterium]|nr:zf-HC2 domain-containing protein [Ignavibacteria bacterium]